MIQNGDGIIEDVIKDFREVGEKGEVLIFCSEGTPYNLEEFVKAAKFAKRKMGATIRVITGPILVVPKKEKDSSKLLCLQEERIINLYHRPSRCSTPHFRVVRRNGNYLLHRLEMPHRPLHPSHERNIVDLSGLSKKQNQLWAKELVYLFESWQEVVADPVKELPLLMLTDELLKILEEAEKRNLPFNQLRPHELKQLHASVK